MRRSAPPLDLTLKYQLATVRPLSLYLGLAHCLLDDHREMRAAVHRASRGGAVVANRTLLAVAHRPQPRRPRSRGSRGSRAPSWRAARRAPGCTRPCRCCRSALRSSRSESGFACSFATASSRIFNASGRRLKRSKSKCTSSNIDHLRAHDLQVDAAGRRSAAVVGRRHGHRDVALPGSAPSTPCSARSALLNVPCGAVHRTSADRRPDRCLSPSDCDVCPGSTTARIAACRDRRASDSAAALAAAGGGGVTVLVTVVVSLITRTRWRGGVTPGCQPTRTSKPHALWSMSSPPTVRPCGAEAVVHAAVHEEAVRRLPDAAELEVRRIGDRAEQRRDAAVLGDVRRIDQTRCCP